jgi:hypothetical protein
MNGESWYDHMTLRQIAIKAYSRKRDITISLLVAFGVIAVCVYIIRRIADVAVMTVNNDMAIPDGATPIPLMGIIILIFTATIMAIVIGTLYID